MYEIKVKTVFSAAHNLKDYHGKCERLHGHNWTVEAVFAYKSLAKDGMAVDFKIAKETLKEAVEGFDHEYLNEVKTLKGVNPTSENIAKFIFDSIAKKNRKINSVAIWENENSCATYRKG
ncbi:6-pyruvoyl tetrahydropterin synthase-related protein [sediment metagenome]|uniref:6-pyruvoyl tetrahydropterin synthase-related protein n=1 Tax=sediment metagenome TaxID=749907 RepID=D9PIB9_9ZZZZ